MTDMTPVRVRTRSTPAPPAIWPNGAEVRRPPQETKSAPLIGWVIRLQKGKYRVWLNAGDPVFLCDSDSFSDGLIRLSTEFDKRLAPQKRRSKSIDK